MTKRRVIKQEPLSPEAILQGFNDIRKSHGLPEIEDTSDKWNSFMDKIGAERGSWQEIYDIFGEENDN